MIVLPAIDLLGGKVVRLRQGRYDDVTIYSDDPVEQARRFADAGAQWLHVVDLDGARDGEPANLRAVEAIADAVDMNVEFGGGIRSIETLKRVVAAGVRRAVLGTALVTDPEFVTLACETFPGIAGGVDARDGKVRIAGWREGTGQDALELVRELAGLGVRRVVYTDIAVDGMQTGIDADAYEDLARGAGIAVVASGGVATLDDVRRLREQAPSVEGVIVGRALYEAAFTLEDALAAASGEG
ncbi:MAG: 1-(5-phosphoribosyl)-5-[(5-phosphoribosylamino)methylideneamino]imidazole-4-carboxamide isomerase [Coriobacteriia bacterium]